MKFFRWMVSLTGILGMGLAMAYLFVVFLAFQPGFSELTYLLVGRSDRELPLWVFSAAVPYVLLLAHLYLRTMFGRWLLQNGHLEEAIEYTSGRLTISLLRSRTEAAFHRLYLAQAQVRKMDYTNAKLTLDGLSRVPRRLEQEYLRWKLEVALRSENLKAANDVRNALRSCKNDACGRAWAAVMELAVRQDDPELFDVAQKNALWALKEDDARLVFSRTMAAKRWQRPMPDGTADAFLAEVPGARLEWCVARGETGSETSGDRRSEWVAGQTQESK